jgi:hypothetical protein
MATSGKAYRKAYDACRKAYAGGTAFGLDFRTISHGWRMALERAACATDVACEIGDLDVYWFHVSQWHRRQGNYRAARRTLAQARSHRVIR